MENMPKTLLVLHNLLYIINIIAFINIYNPYLPNALRVVFEFLLKYGEKGSLRNTLKTPEILIELGLKLK